MLKNVPNFVPKCPTLCPTFLVVQKVHEAAKCFFFILLVDVIININSGFYIGMAQAVLHFRDGDTSGKQ